MPMATGRMGLSDSDVAKSGIRRGRGGADHPIRRGQCSGESPRVTADVGEDDSIFREAHVRVF
jgi:hypothetical protein